MPRKRRRDNDLSSGFPVVRGRLYASAYTELVGDPHPLLDGFPLITTIPVLWGDEDAFGHVNNLVYLRWCETARVEYLQKISMWTELPPAGPGPIVASIKCDYKAQVTYPDTVSVGTRVTAIGNSSFRMEHLVVSHNDRVAAAAVESTLVLFDYKAGKPVRVPDAMREAIADFEGRVVDGARVR